MNYFALLKFLPLIFSTVKAVESAMPESPGKAKLDAALAFITQTEAAIANALPTLTVLVGTVVAAFNTSGFFTKKA